MNEFVATFGEHDNLSGIVTKPDAPPDGVEMPAIILLNAGLVHRVGPFRLHVDLARRMATLGHTVLRFDLSGIGDSKMVRTRKPYEIRILDEVVAAMDYLARVQHCQRFVLAGMCSGARLAHRVAVIDERVAGVIQLDGFGYRVFGWYLRYYWRRIGRLSSWKTALSGWYQSLRTRQSEPEEENVWVDDNDTGFVTKEQMAQDLPRLIERDTNLLLIYTGDVEYYYCYPRQFEETFAELDFRELLTVAVLPEFTHTFSGVKSRQILTELICQWLRDCYAARVSPTP